MADTTQAKGGRRFSDEELQDLVSSTDSGARTPDSRLIGGLIAVTALSWSLFQLWIAVPQFWFAQNVGWIRVLGSEQTRPIHLTFAIFLAFLCYPALKRSPRRHIPLFDWLLALTAGGCAFYVFWFAREISATAREGRLTRWEVDWSILGMQVDVIFPQVIVGALGLVLLLEASRRALGPALAIVGGLFLAYSYFGTGWLIPDLLSHSGRSFNGIINTQWYDTNVGVFGIPLGVSTSFVFLFVLFGSLLDKAGAGNYFIKIAFAGLGHLRGGPAKAAVVGSAMTGVISGSSIANVVTTGTFTIPLMKRVGFSREKAGAVEVASSINGQIMPPVMGAAAFLMVEFVGVSYLEVVKHAFIPAVISYIALVYIVHLEALRTDMKALGVGGSLLQMLLKAFAGFVIFGAVFWAAVMVVGALQSAAPALAGPLLMAVIVALYLGALWIAAARPDLEMDDPNAREVRLPVMREVVPTGLQYLLPIFILIWFLMVERQSPARSAFFAVAMMLLIMVTQKPIKALMRGQGGQIWTAAREGGRDLLDGLIAGARNMVGIGVAVAAAGIIVGTVTRTPIGTELAGLVEALSFGSLFIMLVLVAIFSLVLGLGLPTTANYIVVSSLLGSVVVSLAGQEGLIVPLIAAHLFVFYFGIMADVTPPVGLASFAAAAVSGGDPIRTGVTAFVYSLRTIALPFLFIYNPALILYGIDLGTAAGLMEASLVFVVATCAMLLFAAATQGYFLAPSYKLESAALLLVAFTLFVPNFWMNQVVPPYQATDPSAAETTLGALSEGDRVRLVIEGPDFDTGRITSFTISHVIETDGDGPARIDEMGLFLMPEDGQMVMEEPAFGSRYERDLQRFDFYDPNAPVVLATLEVPATQPPAELFYIPALGLLLIVIALQRRRQTKPAF
ncbi:MAG: TRAP transporter permease [Alkalilacustris sp.]